MNLRQLQHTIDTPKVIRNTTTKWKTKEKGELFIYKMDESHITNCILLLIKRNGKLTEILNLTKFSDDYFTNVKNTITVNEILIDVFRNELIYRKQNNDK